MARIFITGSADGLGQRCATSLLERGHQVVLHARNERRGKDALKRNPGAETVLIADLSGIDEIIHLAETANATGPFDAVIHNAGVYQADTKAILHVNVLTPYILTARMQQPARLVYLSSGMHLHGHVSAATFDHHMPGLNYSDSKLLVVLLCMATARLWKDVYANAVNPGWVPTKMGGPGAPDSLQKGYETQTWLAASKDANALVSGRYFFHQQQKPCHPAAKDIALQQQFFGACEQLSGVSFPSII